MEENQVIEEIRSGNRKTLENIYTMYRKGFIQWTTATWRISPEEAVDIYQQSILSFYENILAGRLGSIRGSIKTYLFAIGKNKVYELQRYQGRTRSLDARMPDFEDTPDEDPECNERLITISRSCLEILGNPCREILESYYYYRRTMLEIAMKLGYKNEQTAKNLKYKCLIRLRDIFRAEVKKRKEYLYE